MGTGTTHDRARERLAGEPWPDALIDALARLRQPEHAAYLVGGTVRDVLLGRPVLGPIDVATDRTPDDVQRLFAHVEPIGIRHGTVLILHGDVRVECTTMRREGVYDDARRPSSVVFTRDPIEDLARRDLTVNAMAWAPDTGELLDPFDGLADLDRRVLRAVGEPRDRFTEDALRPLRVARFAATLDMEPEPRTRAALGVSLDRADRVAAERVRDELQRMLTARQPSRGLELLRESGWLARVLPEIAACVGVAQNRWHRHDVYRHTLLVCDAAPAENEIVRWAALLHDIGKPPTRVDHDGEGTFYGHAEIGARLARARLDALRFPAALRDAIVHLVREHMFDYRPEWSDAAVRRWLRRVGLDQVDALFALRAADVEGTGVPGSGPPLAELRDRVARVLAQSRVLHVRDLAVGGEDVMRILRMSPGPEVGRVLSALLEEVTDDPRRRSREALLERLSEWSSNRVEESSDP